MKVIYRPRNAGKTTELLHLADNHNGYLVVPSMREAQRVLQVARELNLSINLPITFQEFLEGRYHAKGVKTVWIDNADMLIEYMAKAEVGAITLSEDLTGEGKDE